jgi:hypothetical protein
VEENDATMVPLTLGEMLLLIEGLDAYEYWQLGDVLPRNNGLVFLPDDPYGDRYWSPDDEPTEEQQEAIEGVRRCRDLLVRLDDVRRASSGSGDVRTKVERARNSHGKAVEALIPLLIAAALVEVADVLPGAASLEVLGETNEDGLDILRIQRVRGRGDEVIYDIETGHSDQAVEDRIDHVGSEYLDQLLDITYGEYFGEHVLTA